MYHTLLISLSRYLGDLIIGGTDTTAATLGWMLAILVHYPDVCKRLSHEVDAFISKHKRYPVFSERLDLPYFNAVQKECMRYRPTTHFVFFHKIDKDSKGYADQGMGKCDD